MVGDGVSSGMKHVCAKTWFWTPLRPALHETGYGTRYIVPLFDASANLAATCPVNKLDAIVALLGMRGGWESRDRTNKQSSMQPCSSEATSSPGAFWRSCSLRI